MKHGRKILVVDDEDSWRNFWLDMLADSDYEVEAVDNADVPRLVNECLYDFLILDIMMEGKNGIDIFNEVRALDQRCRVIALSNLERDSPEAAWFRERGVPFFNKGDGNFIDGITACMGEFTFKEVRELSVLIVDDEELKRDTYAQLLRGEGVVDIEVCASLEEAERLMAERCFDVYLIDICFPERGVLVPKGSEFVSALLRSKGCEYNAVIPMSTEDVAQECLSGLTGNFNLHPFMLKQPAQLAEKIGDILLRGPFVVRHA